MVGLISVALLGGGALVRDALRLILIEPHFCITQLVDDHSMISIGMSEDIIIVIDETDSFNDWLYIDRLRNLLPSTKVVVLDDFATSEKVIAAFSVGVDSYIINQHPPATLISVLQLVASGQKMMPSYVIDALTIRQRTPINLPILNASDLSVRESEILGCLVVGDSNKVFARKLFIAESTVKVHVKAVLRKLNVSNRTQAAIFGINGGTETLSSGSQPSVPDTPTAHHAKIEAARSPSPPIS